MTTNKNILRELRFIISKRYKQLTERDKDFLYEHHVINGCGGKWSSFRPPMYLFFHADCNIHDFTYTQGYYLFKNHFILLQFILRVWHRWRCDWGFYKVMIRDIWVIRWAMGSLSTYGAVRGTVMATIYLIAVRLAGWRFYGKPIDNLP